MEIEDEEKELGILLEMDVNRLAATFYHMNGRVFDPKINFRESFHPEEKGCWNKAIAAYAFINKDDFYLQFQVE